MSRLNRRQLMRGILTLCGTWWEAEFRTDNDLIDKNTELGTAIEHINQLYKAATKKELPDSPETPAVGLTDEGWFEYSSQDRGWSRISLGAQANPIDEGYVRDFQVQNQSNIVYAANFEGDTLSAKVSNAIERIRDGGKIVITPKPNGERWQWGKQLTLNPVEYNGIEIEALHNTGIEYNGDNWVFDIDATPAGNDDYYYSPNDPKKQFLLSGGDWFFTGENPNGWLRLRDTYGARISPRYVSNVRNSENLATVILIEAVDEFTEGHEILGGLYQDIDIGIRCQSINEPRSFDNMVVERVHFDSVWNTGIWFSESAYLHAATFIAIGCWIAGEGSRGWFFDNPVEGATIMNPKVESLGEAGGHVGIEIGPNNSGSVPSVVDPAFLDLDTDIVSPNATVPVWP